MHSRIFVHVYYSAPPEVLLLLNNCFRRCMNRDVTHKSQECNLSIQLDIAFIGGGNSEKLSTHLGTPPMPVSRLVMHKEFTFYVRCWMHLSPRLSPIPAARSLLQWNWLCQSMAPHLRTKARSKSMITNTPSCQSLIASTNHEDGIILS